MTPEARTLVVWANDRIVGRLTEHNDLWRFDYEPAWSRDPRTFDLTPTLPRTQLAHIDGASQRPVQWFFDNLLPEEKARELLAKDARLDSADAFGLLAYYGAESAGALTLLPEHERLEAGGEQALSFAELSARIRALPQVSLSADSPKRMSMAGAQHKLPIVFRGGRLYWPTGSAPSTHILKPDHPDSYYTHSTANEWYCMRLAKRLGLPVPAVELLHVPEPAYLVERFDRRRTPRGLERRHMIDVCQTLGLAAAFKYREATPVRLVDVIERARSKARSRHLIYQWVLFNLLIGNDDAHLKNLSFFMSADGLELTPFYDLVSTAAFRENGAWMTDEIAWKVDGIERLADVTREKILALADSLGVPSTVATRILEQMRRTIESAADEVLAEYEAIARTCAAPETEGAARHLRTIRYGVIRDMVTKL